MVGLCVPFMAESLAQVSCFTTVWENLVLWCIFVFCAKKYFILSVANKVDFNLKTHEDMLSPGRGECE